MNPTDIRPDVTPSAPAQPPLITKMDTPLPVPAPIVEISDSASASASSERIISGIDLIDFSAGGLLPGHLYLVKGSRGVGKSIAGLQFLTRGLEQQEPGILITDQKPENVLAQARAIGFSIDQAVQRRQLTILNPSERYFDLVESPADVMAIVEELADYIRNSDARRLVIDPVFTLVNTSYSAHFAVALTQSLLNALEDLPTTTLLIAGDDEQNERGMILRAIEQNAFGVVNLTHDIATGGRLMRLSNLRYADCENVSARYRILNGRGLMNYSGDESKVADVTKPWEETSEMSRNVLLVGAQPDMVARVRESLGDAYKIDSEGDLRAGIERARRENPGLVLVTPSRTSGAVAAILELARDCRSSVAFLSPSNNRQSDRVLYLRAGADDFISEPFNPAELRARVDALIRRSGRRLTDRDSRISSITPDDLSALMQASSGSTQKKKGRVFRGNGDSLTFEPQFNERLQRSIDTVSKFDTPFALYWMKSERDDAELSRTLAKLCRQEDILCHNRDGEFVAILTGTDQHGLRGFEQRIEEKLGNRLGARVKRGYKLYQPGDSTTGFAERALEAR
jgi:KaiC/GvpD/RAD55 family RecA-like ATPase/DNA-binding response OmpR family regulator